MKLGNGRRSELEKKIYLFLWLFFYAVLKKILHLRWRLALRWEERSLYKSTDLYMDLCICQSGQKSKGLHFLTCLSWFVYGFVSLYEGNGGVIPDYHGGAAGEVVTRTNTGHQQVHVPILGVGIEGNF